VIILSKNKKQRNSKCNNNQPKYNINISIDRQVLKKSNIEAYEEIGIMKNKYISRKELFRILCLRLLISSMVIVAFLFVLLYLGINYYRRGIHIKLNYRIILLFLIPIGYFIIDSINTIIDFILIDIAKLECKNATIDLAHKEGNYIITYMDEKNNQDSIYLGVVEGTPHYPRIELSSKADNIYIYYTKRSKYFIGFKDDRYIRWVM
jgi:hypothetical protein